MREKNKLKKGCILFMVLMLMLRLQKSEIELMGKLLIEMCEFHDYKLQFNKTLL